jgi:hypothetical protein
MKYKIFIALSLVLLFTVAVIAPAEAQCAMCKAAAEANLKSGGSDPAGLNSGILYMLFMPYLIVLSIAIWWYRNRRKEAAVDIPYNEDELARLN